MMTVRASRTLSNIRLYLTCRATLRRPLPSKSVMDNLLQDARYGIRTLIRQPGFAATAILTLALGIGATTAIFSVVNAVVLRPMPFDQPDRIMVVTNTNTKTGARNTTISGPDFFDWRRQQHLPGRVAVQVRVIAHVMPKQPPVAADRRELRNVVTVRQEISRPCAASSLLLHSDQHSDVVVPIECGPEQLHEAPEHNKARERGSAQPDASPFKRISQPR